MMQSRETWIHVLKNLGAHSSVLRRLRADGVTSAYSYDVDVVAQLGAILAAKGVICPPVVPPHERMTDLVSAGKIHVRVIWPYGIHTVKLRHYPLWRHAHWYYPIDVLDDGVRVLAERWSARKTPTHKGDVPWITREVSYAK